MATIYKVLGQSNPTAITATTLYTVPANTSAVVSSLNICNQAATSATFRIAIRPAGATLTTSQYLSYDTTVPANDTISMNIGMSLATTDVITVYASSATVSFILFGTELT
jgi:glucose-6-phosphate dehydrogenase assembly protein OpcA